MKRRSFLQCVGAGASACLVASRADATLVEGLRLPELVHRSLHVVVLQALDARSSFQQIGGRRRIVTDTRVRIEDTLGRTAPGAQELVVRTLGGRVDGMGQLALGQAVFSWTSPDVAFLKRGADGAHWFFVGMAQGQYPLIGAATDQARLATSANLPEIRSFSGSAVQALSGVKLTVARQLVREVEPT